MPQRFYNCPRCHGNRLTATTTVTVVVAPLRREATGLLPKDGGEVDLAPSDTCSCRGCGYKAPLRHFEIARRAVPAGDPAGA